MLRYRALIACSLFVFAGLVLAALSSPELIGQEKVKDPGRVKWEYKVASVRHTQGPDVRDKLLRELGDDGWELSAATYSENGSLSDLYFKRQK